MSTQWGALQYTEKTASPGRGGWIVARFFTNNTEDPVDISDPSGMLAITRKDVGVYTVTLADRWTKVMPMADYQGGTPVLWARITGLTQGNTTPNKFDVRMETDAGAATETSDRQVQLFIHVLDQPGRVDTEGF